MSTTSPAADPFRLDLGVYAIGALDPAAAAALEAHLTTCPGCRADLADVRAVLPALGQLTLAQVASPAGDLPARAAATVAALHRARHRALRRRVGAAAGGLAVAAALIGAVVVGERDDGARVLAAGDRTTNVRAQVRLSGDPGGTLLALRLDGVPPKIVCALVAVSRDGRRQTAATWIANYEGEAEVRGQVGIRAGDLWELQVVRDDGQPLITLPITT